MAPQMPPAAAGGPPQGNPPAGAKAGGGGGGPPQIPPFPFYAPSFDLALIGASVLMAVGVVHTILLFRTKAWFFNIMFQAAFMFGLAMIMRLVLITDPTLEKPAQLMQVLMMVPGSLIPLQLIFSYTRLIWWITPPEQRTLGALVLPLRANSIILAFGQTIGDILGAVGSGATPIRDPPARLASIGAVIQLLTWSTLALLIARFTITSRRWDIHPMKRRGSLQLGVALTVCAGLIAMRGVMLVLEKDALSSFLALISKGPPPGFGGGGPPPLTNAAFSSSSAGPALNILAPVPGLPPDFGGGNNNNNLNPLPLTSSVNTNSPNPSGPPPNNNNFGSGPPPGFGGGGPPGLPPGLLPAVLSDEWLSWTFDFAPLILVLLITAQWHPGLYLPRRLMGARLNTAGLLRDEAAGKGSVDKLGLEDDDDDLTSMGSGGGGARSPTAVVRADSGSGSGSGGGGGGGGGGNNNTRRYNISKPIVQDKEPGIVTMYAEEELGRRYRDPPPPPMGQYARAL